LARSAWYGFGGWPIFAGTIIAEAAPPIVVFDGWEAMTSTCRCESSRRLRDAIGIFINRGLAGIPRPSFAWAGILISPHYTFIPTVTSNLVHNPPLRSSCSQPGSELRTQKLPPSLGLRGNFHLTLLSDVFCEEKSYAVDSREFPKEGGRHIPQRTLSHATFRRHRKIYFGQKFTSRKPGSRKPNYPCQTNASNTRFDSKFNRR
jgi:hypothetical protein